MDIQSLKLLVTEDEANHLLGELRPKDLEAENLRVRFTPEGVCVSGETSALLFKVSFETTWDVSAAAGCVIARLSGLKVAGIPAGKLRGVLLKMLRDAVPKEPGITVEEDVVRVDVNEVLRARGVPVRIKPTAVRCGEKELVVEA